MFIKKFLKPKKDSSTTVIRNFGFANTTSSSGQGGISDLSNIDSKNINTINLSAANAEISNLTNQNLTNTNSAIFEGELIGRGTVDLENAAVKLGSNNTFDELTGSDTSKLYANDITCDYLTVNKKAHFFELVIDKIKTVGGTVIFTPADGFTIDKVVEGNDDYILFWRACTEIAEGEIGDTISATGQTMTEPVSVNMWQEWDQALCQSFNLGDESDYYFDVSNRYWWRTVEAASDEPEIQEINGVKYYCHWIMVYKNGTSSTTGKPFVDTGSDVPAVGDAVAMLGYRYDELVSPAQDDINRASAIIIAAYQTPDGDIVPPSYAQYQGIKDFSLSAYRKTFFDATRSKIFGEFVVDASGQEIDLDDYIRTQTELQEATIIVESNNAVVDMCIMQTDSNGYIHDLNNLPGTDSPATTPPTRFMYVSIYTDQSYFAEYVKCDLFGRTVVLMDIDPNTGYPRLLPTADTANGIYIHSVTTTSNKLCVTFAFRGTGQEIINGSSIQFYGKVILNRGTQDEKTLYPSQTISIAAVSSVEGVDAKFYGLNTILENVQVDGNQTLQPELIYNLKYIEGTSVTYPVPSTQTLRVTTYLNNGTSSTVPVQWDNANNYWRFYPNATTNYYTKTKETPPVAVPIYYKVELVDNNIVVDAKVVDVQLSPMATFSVGADLTTLIYAETTRVENESNNKYASLLVNINGLTSTVSNITNDLTGVHGDISRIDQKANDINLSVTNINNGLQTTGIDITNGKITLTADNTDIQGNLNIYNAQEGLVIYDYNKLPRIIVTNAALNFNASIPPFELPFEETKPYEGNDIYYGSYVLGRLDDGNKIGVRALAVTTDSTQTISSINAKINVLKDGAQKQQWAGNMYFDDGKWRFILTGEVYDVQQYGEYSLQVILTVTGASINDNFNLYTESYLVIGGYNRIGTNAALFAYDSNKLAYFGSECNTLRYGDYNHQAIVEVNANGAEYQPNNYSEDDTNSQRRGIACELGSVMSLHRCTSGSSYYATAYDGLITVNPGVADNFWIYLPNPATMPGKIYYLKRVMTNINVYVYTTNGSGGYIENIFIDEDNSDGRLTSFSLSDLSYMVVSDGEYWILFYCG